MTALLLPPSVRARDEGARVLEFANPDWVGTSAPLICTPYDGGISRGEDVVDFAPGFLKATRGFRRGEPLIMTIWQQELIRRILEEKEDGYLRYRQVLIGLPRKNGKSLLGTALALYKLALHSNAGTQIYSAARNREQAKIVFSEAAKQVRQNPILNRLIKVNRDHMINKSNGAIYKALSAHGGSAQGLAPELVIADEIHAWPDRAGSDLWQALTEGSGDRPESQVIAITTAGKNHESLLGSLMAHGKGVIEGNIDDPTFGLFWWAADPDAFAGDEEAWFQANPNLVEGLYSMDDMRSSYAKAQTEGMDAFERYRLNRFAVSADDMWLTTNQIEKAFEAGGVIPLGSSIAVGIDAAISEDSTAIVGIDVRTGVAKLLDLFEKTSDDWTTPMDELNARVENISRMYDVVSFQADPKYLSQSLLLWGKLPGLRGKIMDLPQSPSRMAPAVGSTKLAISTGKLKLVNDREGAFKRHLSCAVLRSNGMIGKKSNRSREKIDAADALTIAMSAWTRYAQIRARAGATTYGGH